MGENAMTDERREERRGETSMGLYDSLYWRCGCGQLLEWQSKSGECSMTGYHLGNLPADVAGGLADDVQRCENCGREYIARIQTMVQIEEWKDDF